MCTQVVLCVQVRMHNGGATRRYRRKQKVVVEIDDQWDYLAVTKWPGLSGAIRFLGKSICRGHCTLLAHCRQEL